MALRIETWNKQEMYDFTKKININNVVHIWSKKTTNVFLFLTYNRSQYLSY